MADVRMICLPGMDIVSVRLLTQNLVFQLLILLNGYLALCKALVEYLKRRRHLSRMDIAARHMVRIAAVPD